MTKQSQKPITTQTPPQSSSIGGKISHNKGLYEEAIENQGYNIFIEKAIKCPCKSKGTDSALPSCSNCRGYGWVFINKVQTRGIVHSMNLKTEFKEWSETNLGNASLTIRDVNKIAFMDRITINDGETIHSQRLYPYHDKRRNEIYAAAIYDIVEMQELYLFDGSDNKLVLLQQDVDYVIRDNFVILDNKYISKNDFLGLHLSARYTHRPQYHVMDITRDVMVSQIRGFGINGDLDMPVNAMIRRSHYVVDEENLEGNLILDNSYLGDDMTGCKIKQPTNLTTTPISNAQVDLAWLDNSDNEAGYIVERSTNNKDYLQLSILAADVSTYSDTTVVASTSYFYRVIAFIADGSRSLYSNISGTTTPV